MKNILCFGDSNTWGFAPENGGRYPQDLRWTGVLRSTLGDGFHVIEEGLNGRTTAFDEPGRPHRNGLTILPALLESHRPLDLVVIMLGTNDLKTIFDLSAGQIAQGARRLCEAVLSCEFLPPGHTEVLLVSPSLVTCMPDADAEEFMGAAEKSREFAREYRKVAEELGIGFFDAAQVVETSALDGVHWDADQHEKFGRELAGKVRELLCDR
jgi:lysophospholipase L1-like esterase